MANGSKLILLTGPTGSPPSEQGNKRCKIRAVQFLRKGAAGYEAARRATSFNARLPDRLPDVIAQAESVYDVVAAVRLAKKENLRIGVRSGGHSWSAHPVRDGGMLL